MGMISISIPQTECPACGHTDNAGYIGNHTGDIVLINQEHYADERGYLYCAKCGEVWEKILYITQPAQNSPDHINRVGDHDGSEWVAVSNRTPKWTHPQDRRIQDRIWDIEALCALLSLPNVTRDAATHHASRFFEEVNLKKVSPRIRAETWVVAIVHALMERHGIRRDDSVSIMLDSLRARDKGPQTKEFDSAYNYVTSWFGARFWRDSPADAKFNPLTTRRKQK